MRPITFAVLLLAGCASPQGDMGSYGNFVSNAPAALEQKMAADAVKQLLALYPPATTRFDLQQRTPDAFGAALVDALRGQGYALSELPPASAATAQTFSKKPGDTPGTQTTPPLARGLALRYVLDQAPDASLYRLTLHIDAQLLTRAYLVANHTVAPAGYWIRKE